MEIKNERLKKRSFLFWSIGISLARLPSATNSVLVIESLQAATQ
jgi:hypothetical protein